MEAIYTATIIGTPKSLVDKLTKCHYVVKLANPTHEHFETRVRDLKTVYGKIFDSISALANKKAAVGAGAIYLTSLMLGFGLGTGAMLLGGTGAVGALYKYFSPDEIPPEKYRVYDFGWFGKKRIVPVPPAPIKSVKFRPDGLVIDGRLLPRKSPINRFNSSDPSHFQKLIGAQLDLVGISVGGITQPKDEGAYSQELMNYLRSKQKVWVKATILQDSDTSGQSQHWTIEFSHDGRWVRSKPEQHAKSKLSTSYFDNKAHDGCRGVRFMDLDTDISFNTPSVRRDEPDADIVRQYELEAAVIQLPERQAAPAPLPRDEAPATKKISQTPPEIQEGERKIIAAMLSAARSEVASGLDWKIVEKPPFGSVESDAPSALTNILHDRRRLTTEERDHFRLRDIARTYCIHDHARNVFYMPEDAPVAAVPDTEYDYECRCFRKGFALRVAALVMFDERRRAGDTANFTFQSVMRDPERVMRKFGAPSETSLYDYAAEITEGMDDVDIDELFNLYRDQDDEKYLTLDGCKDFLKKNLKLLDMCRSVAFECGSTLNSIPTIVPNRINVDIMDMAITGQKNMENEHHEMCVAHYVLIKELEVIQMNVGELHNSIFTKVNRIDSSMISLEKKIRAQVQHIKDVLLLYDDQVTLSDIIGVEGDVAW